MRTGAGLLVILGGLLPCAATWAHHGTQASRLGPGAARLGGAGGPGLSLDVEYSYARFDTPLKGSAVWPTDAPVVVRVHTTRLRLGLASRAGGFAELQLPWASLAGASGLGDVEARAGWALNRDRWFLAGAALVVAPTGAYAPRAALSRTEIGGTVADLRLTTHETRATVGTGTPWLGAAAQAGLAPGPQLQITLGAEWRAPLGAAPDGARWGQTAQLEATAGWTLAERLTLSAGLGGRWRGDDRLPPEPEAHDDDPDPRGGAARELRGLLRVRLALGAGHVSAALDAPLARHVAGLQLVDAYALSLGVGWRWR